MAPANPQAVNKWAGRIVPTFLAGTVTYATYVFVAQICVNFLLKGYRPRPGICAALLTIYFILCLFMAITYGRLVYIVTVDPGYLPLGPAAKRHSKATKKRSRRNNGTAVRANDALGPEYPSSETAIARDDGPDSPGLELFYTKDIFVCSQDGRPKWCSECANWKPDRTHHCSDIGRCVYKMDHYCPWVGGVVGENSFKFFVQFVAYAFFYCLFVVVVAAIYLSEDLSNTSELNGHFVAPISFLAPLYCLSSPASAPHDETISDPEVLSERDTRATRTFAILQLAVGRNPWDLGAVGNWKSVMGNNFLEWVLPIKQSPCRNHESHESQFETGRWMEELLVEVGFMSEQDMRKPLPFSGRKLKGPKPAIMEKSGVAPAITAECIPRNAH
ncbi:hypothetical protein O988_08712 [Pseudogymnoascus sp. VKM F-3808]|nr:hypothetical protein O988_08712 [Pseudogymnoascus sp. VKM F-3808]